jgi:hypothetical protein
MEERVDSATQDPRTDYTMMIAPKEGDGPNLPALRLAFENTVRDCSAFVSQCRLNFETRYAIWNGQSADGKKHAREGADLDPTPWDGASDMKNYVADQIVNEKVAMQCMSFKRANLEAVPIQGADITRAKDVTNFMKWLVYSQVPEVDREVEMLSQFINEKGVAMMGAFWETTQDKTLDRLRLVDFQAKFPQVNLLEMLNDPVASDALKEILKEHYEISDRKANTMVKELRETGETSIPVLGRAISRPILRAFNLDEDVFVPPFATDIELCPYIFRVQYFTADKLRSFAYSEGWDEAWVEQAILKLRGRMIPLVPDQNLAPISRNFIYRYQRYHDLIGVVYAYQRMTDEDGVSGIYLTIFNPMLPPDEKQNGFAKFGLLGYKHGQYPFTLFRREQLTRRLHDSRGIPEVAMPSQNMIKAHRDARIDAASIGIIPPLAYPAGRAPARWGPGAKIPERRAGEYHYLDKPTIDLNNENSEKILTDALRDYFAIATENGDPIARDLQNQFHINKFLGSMTKAFTQVWKLYQQFGDDNVYYRVLGQNSMQPTRFGKGEPTEEYQFFLNFDVQSMNAEQVEKKLTQLFGIAVQADKYGQVDWTKMLQIGMSSIDPTIAEAVIMPRQTATQQVVSEEKNALSRIFAGFVEDFDPKTPPDIAEQVMIQWMQMPDVTQRYQGDQVFKARVDTRMKQIQQAKNQQVNAQTGRLGATFQQVMQQQGIGQ